MNGYVSCFASTQRPSASDDANSVLMKKVPIRLGFTPSPMLLSFPQQSE